MNEIESLRNEVQTIKDAVDELALGVWPDGWRSPFIAYVPPDFRKNIGGMPEPYELPPEKVMGFYECLRRKIDTYGASNRLNRAEAAAYQAEKKLRERDALLSRLHDLVLALPINLDDHPQLLALLDEIGGGDE